MKLAIDLLWVRHKKVGGIESYIRNLLDGLLALNYEYEIWLLVSKDNRLTFEEYALDGRFHIYECNIYSSNVKKRIIWQNLFLNRTIIKLGIDKCFEPYYCKPFLGNRKVKYITTIHDLQALHFPYYFSKIKEMWMKLSWRNAIKSSSKIIAISEYVKYDIIKNFKVDPTKVEVIYNPITISDRELKDFEHIGHKYNVEKNEYYFTVSSLLPHKNIQTLIRVFKKIKDEKINLPCKLVISGVGGKLRTEFEKSISEFGLKDNIFITDFLDNSERNALYKYCRAFLFPSIFEGFGMPPIEAMYFNVPVITTRESCLVEVTQGKANYVDDPYNIDEWIGRMSDCVTTRCDLSIYDRLKIARQYLTAFE